jgi:transcription elongation factor GreA
VFFYSKIIGLTENKMEKVPITRSGFEKLKKDLEYLKKVAVPENIRAIEEARGHGDISENAEYAAAKERQSFIQGKIQEIENNLAISQVIDIENLSEEKVVFGSTVTIEDAETGERTAYKLVGPFESDIQQNKISVTSPIGKALIGKAAGDEVRVKTPGGLRVLQVVDIRIGVDA